MHRDYRDYRGYREGGAAQIKKPRLFIFELYSLKL